MKILRTMLLALFLLPSSAIAFDALPLLDNGHPTVRLDIVVVGDGYTEAEQGKLKADAQTFINEFFDAEPFASLKERFSIYLVPVVSAESGADYSDALFDEDCEKAKVQVDTFFDCQFCTNGVQRGLVCDDKKVFDVADDAYPDWDYLIVLVNSASWGATGGDAVMTLAAGAFFFLGDVARHEAGHAIALLDDEYEDCTPYPEWMQQLDGPNITVETSLGAVPWKDYIAASTPVPTFFHIGCPTVTETCGPNLELEYQYCSDPNGTVADGAYWSTWGNVVGLFEGGRYKYFGNFRPTTSCAMRGNSWEFCPVCHDELVSAIKSYAPDFSAEVCDGLDNDWNGVVDDGFEGKCDDGIDCTVDGCSHSGYCKHTADNSLCVDDNPCTKGSCWPKEGCKSTPIVAECDDGDVCTVNQCKQGECIVAEEIDDCCTAEEHCGSPLSHCDFETNRCLHEHCKPCGSDEDCPLAGTQCTVMESGSYCTVECSVVDSCSPLAAYCDLKRSPPRCIPLRGDCYCEPTADIGCHDGKLFYFDGCGVPTDVITSCAGRGCANGTCCMKDTHQEGEQCVVDGPPRRGTHGSKPEARAPDEATTPPPGAPDNGRALSGCSAGPASLPATSSLWLLALLLAATSRMRRPGNRFPPKLPRE